tara:strand:- start:5806 stop:6996 length:1191 start_codon:yes stop_codon:yes gene_type:complete
MAIGTSHLVLSTKAGAQYGWIMVIPIILANLLKYPFFEFGVRYTIVTNKSIIEGYRNRGKGYFWFYAFMTLISIFTILATLYVVTAGLFINLFGIRELPVHMAALGLFAFISALLIVGKYQFLESSLKLVVSILFLALLITTVLVVSKGGAVPSPGFEAPAIFDEVGVLFLIGLIGWMPTAVETSSWISLWTLEKVKVSNKILPLVEALQEFRVGYMLTALLALFFMIIGWLTLYGTNTAISGNAVTFSDQLVQLFTAHIGSWTYPLIATAAFATMFSTCITAHDALARVSLDIVGFISPKVKANRPNFALAVLLLATINFAVVRLFSANMGQLVAVATFISFVLAPLIGYMNLRNVMSNDLPLAYRPKRGLRTLTYIGIIFLSLFAFYYCWILLQ